MGGKYEVRTGDGESHWFQSWFQYVLFRFKNRGNVLYVRVNFF